MIEELIANALKGLVITCIGLAVYSTGFRYFKSIDGDFDTKESAQITTVGFFIVAGILGDPFVAILTEMLNGLELSEQVGTVVIFSRFTVNMMVPNWTHIDDNSMWVYLGGTLLIVSPNIF